MGPCPAGYTIERKDYDGNYDPGNCCWIPKSQQSKNRSNCTPVNLNGQMMSIAEAAQVLGLQKWTLRRRIAAGWTIEQVRHQMTGGALQGSSG